MRVLVEARSGPNAAQRRALAEVTRTPDGRFVILTESVVVRGILAALAWLGAAHGACSPNDWRTSGDFPELSAAEYAQVQREMAQLLRQMGRDQANAGPLNGVRWSACFLLLGKIFSRTLLERLQ